MEELKFTEEEINAMEQMLKVFEKMQRERDIDPEKWVDPGEDAFPNTFNNAMCSLIDLMWLTEDTEKIVHECGY